MAAIANAHVCPWQAGKLLSSPVRRLLQNPERILEPYISEGMTVMDVGCGMGYFSIPMAKLAGAAGKVVAADLQPEMLEGLLINAEKAGVKNRIETRPCGQRSMNIEDLSDKIDLSLLFMMLHEVPDRERLAREVYAALKPGGKLLFAEPVVHVGKASFDSSLQMMRGIGFAVAGTPKISFCRAALLVKAK